jgi:predicted polyphosphate/ATP-dependent NAD kinase
MTAKNIDPPILKKKTVGFIVNPIAGMGGAVGLKGTDGEAILQKAVQLGAKPIAAKRANAFLSELKIVKDKFHLSVGAGSMGEEEALNCDLACTVVGKTKDKTNAEDTRKTAKKMAEAKVDLLVFCGGDGTARNVLEAIDMNVPCLGVPTGVKMHSAVFAVDPRSAAQIALCFLNGELALREAEVMDVDEDAFRAGRVSAELNGYLLAPYEPFLFQGSKIASPMTESELRNQAAIAIFIIETMKPDILYIVGPGTTTRTIGDLLDIKKTLLGVDLFLNKAIFERDVNEKLILESIQGKEAVIIVTPIGGQGFIFGRGNQQISSKVIRQVGLENIIVVASRSKLNNLKSLRVDTGDSELDSLFRTKRLAVVVDYKVLREMPIE